MTDDSESLSQFLDFINQQLDLSALDAPPQRLTPDEIERLVMPDIRADIHRETHRIVEELLRHPQADHWRGQLAPYHREIRDCLAPCLLDVLQQQTPQPLDADYWLDMITFVITVAWLVRKQMDGDDIV